MTSSVWAAGLTGATLVCWFKTLLAELLHQWQGLASLTAALSKLRHLRADMPSAHLVCHIFMGRCC